MFFNYLISLANMIQAHISPMPFEVSINEKDLEKLRKIKRFADQNFNSIASIRLHHLPLASLTWFPGLIDKACPPDHLCYLDICKWCIQFQMFQAMPYCLSNNDKETVFSIILIFQYDRCFNIIIDMFQNNANQLLNKRCYFDHTNILFLFRSGMVA